MKRIFIVHQWGGTPQSDWYRSVADSLKQKGFVVIIPEMPNTKEPEINAWVSHLTKEIGKPDKDTYFIGHSIGCQAIMRYLQSLSERVKVNTIIFVAPWFHLQNLEVPESEKIAKPWLESPINFVKINEHITKLTCIFSDNDQWVPVSDKEVFRELLNAKIIVEHNKGHFTEDDGIKDLPIVVKELEGM